MSPVPIAPVTWTASCQQSIGDDESPSCNGKPRKLSTSSGDCPAASALVSADGTLAQFQDASGQDFLAGMCTSTSKPVVAQGAKAPVQMPVGALPQFVNVHRVIPP